MKKSMKGRVSMIDEPVYVLGINYGHNASACLLKNGRIVCAIEKERIDRVKYSEGEYVQPVIDYCLEFAGIKIEDVSLIVKNSSYHKLASASQKEIVVSHHLAHAFSVIGTSPFKECAVMVCDGSGNTRKEVEEWQVQGSIPDDFEEAESLYYWNEKQLKLINKNWGNWIRVEARTTFEQKKELYFKSFGHMYSVASKYVFGRWEDAGKLMGLAAYGKKLPLKILFEKNGVLDINMNYIDEFKNKGSLKNRFQECADLARTVQEELEEGLLSLAKHLKCKVATDNLCIAGGVGLNTNANSRLFKESGFKNIFIFPACGDAGIAVGCAYYGHIIILKGNSYPLQDVYLGREYSEEEIKKAFVNRTDVQYSKESNIVRKTAELIVNGKIIGWFQGRSEFGPRALGNRSIICDPRNPLNKDIVNSKIKKREWFRPLAPSILREHSAKYFDDVIDSPFMLFVAQCKKEFMSKIPSALHVDGTGRIQTITYDQNPRFYGVIKSFYDLTGVPVLLNTSFNRNNEPLVETPEDAVRSFVGTDLDYLVLGDFLIWKK
jgi:carbamoyltransferase